MAAGPNEQPGPATPPDRETVRALVDEYDYWFQRIHLGHGVYTKPETGYHETVWRAFLRCFPDDLGGASVLDVGCNAGYFSIQAKLRGAGRVLGIEPWPVYLQQARKIGDVWKLGIEFDGLDAHDLDRVDEQFDLVFLCGLLYHLKNPLLVLEHVGRLCRDAVILDTEIIPESRRNRVRVRSGAAGGVRMTTARSGFMKFVEGHELGGDGSNWWVPDTECVLGMLRTAGFTHFSRCRYFQPHKLLLVASKTGNSMLDLDAF